MIDLKLFFEQHAHKVFSEKGWSQDKIVSANLSALDMDLRLSSEVLILPQANVTEAALSVLTRDGRVEISIGDGKVFDGQVSGALSLRKKKSGGLKTYGALGLTNIRLEDALRELFGVVRLAGKGSASLGLSSEGETFEQLADHLQGEALIKISEGNFAGIDLAALIKKAEAGGAMDAFLEARSGRSPSILAALHSK